MDIFVICEFQLKNDNMMPSYHLLNAYCRLLGHDRFQPLQVAPNNTETTRDLI